jgi:outer membrane protein assembly factor BamB
MRHAYRIAVVLALALPAGCSMFSSTDNSPKMAALMEMQNAGQTRLIWQASLGGSGANTLAPAVSGSSVFAAARDGTLARLDAASGAQVWRIQTGQTLTGGVGSDGKLVVVGTGKGLVLAYDADGKPAWTALVSSEVMAPPAVADGLVVVRAGDNRIFGLEAATGKRRWVAQRASPTLVARSSAGAVIAGASVYAGFAAGKLAAISAQNGATRWEATVSTPRGATELERISDVTSPPVVASGMVCAVAFQGRLSCFEEGNGNQVWSRDVSSTAGIAVDVRYVFVSDDKGAVHAFDRATGASVWKQDKLAYRQLSAPVSQGRFVAVADVQGYIHFLNREDGALAARIATDGSAISAEMKAVDRMLLAQTRSGGLFAVTAQ